MLTQPQRGFGGVPISTTPGESGRARAAVMGVVSSAGAPRTGAENGPAFLRVASRRYTWGYSDAMVMDAETRHSDLMAVDLGDVVPVGKTAQDVSQEIAETVASIDVNCVPCVIGGDHSITVGVIDGLIARATPPVRVIQFDQHLDVQLWPAITSEPIDPLFNTNVVSHIGSRLGNHSVLQIGINPFITISESSKETLNASLNVSSGIIPITSPLLRDKAALLNVLGDGIPTYVTIDVDVIKQSQMRSTGYPAHIGMDIVDLIQLVNLVLRTNPIVGLDIVEFSAPSEAREEPVLSDAMRASDVLMSALVHLTS